MYAALQKLFLAMILAALGATLLACASTRPPPVSKVASKDFSGAFEMNYGRSETANGKLQAMYLALQREAERLARSGGHDPYSREPTISVDGSTYNSVQPLLDLAKFAEMVSGSTVVEIAQSAQQVAITRNDDFTLNCDFFDPGDIEANAPGTESCGWDGEDMIFHIELPDRLDIFHRLTLAPDGTELRIATTVSSDGRNFTLNKFYYRFDQQRPEFDCEFTLTRGNVCSRKAS